MIGSIVALFLPYGGHAMDDDLIFVNEDLVCEEGYLLRVALCMSDRIKQDLPVLHKSHLRVVRCIEIKLLISTLGRDEIQRLKSQRQHYQARVDGYQGLTNRLQIAQADLCVGHTVSFADFLEEFITLCRCDGSQVIRSAQELLGEDLWEFIERLREEDPGSPLN